MSAKLAAAAAAVNINKSISLSAAVAAEREATEAAVARQAEADAPIHNPMHDLHNMWCHTVLMQASVSHEPLQRTSLLCLSTGDVPLSDLFASASKYAL